MRPLHITHLVDCGSKIGLGHLQRQLVLAEALRAEGAVCRFGLSDPEVGIELLPAAAETFVWDRTDLPRDESDALVVDSYKVDPALLVPAGPVLVVMDDLADRPVTADLLVNHNAYGDGCDYGAYSVKQVLAGPRYAMVSAAFRKLRHRPGEAILVNFGATDDGRLSLDLVAALRAHLPDAPILVALMQVSPGHREALESLGAELRVGRPLEESIAEARVYVGAAGLSLLEALVAGRRPVACGIADNQRLNVAFLRRRGLPAFDRPRPQEMAQAAGECYVTQEGTDLAELDGLGAARVARAIIAAVRSRAKAP